MTGPESIGKSIASAAAIRPAAKPGRYIVRVNTEREVVLLPSYPRQWSQVEPGLRDTFGKLCRGELPWPLLLWGDTGRGKTSAALCMHDWVFCGGYITAAKLRDKLFQDDEWDWWEWMAHPAKQFQCVDELAHDEDKFEREFKAIKQILDARELNHNRQGVYVTNQHPDALRMYYDDTIHGRLTCGTIYQVTGRDRRQDARREA